MTTQEILNSVSNTFVPNTTWLTIPYSTNIIYPYDERNPNYVINGTGANFSLSLTNVTSGKGGMVIINRAASEVVTFIGEVVVGNAPITGTVRYTFVQEPSGLKWYCNNPVQTNASSILTDLTFSTNLIGPVLKDRTNSNTYRVYINNGALQVEIVTTPTPPSNFTPLTNTGTIGWFDASNTSSLNPTTLTTWNDLSPSAQHLTITSGVTKETFAGKDFARFALSGSKVGTPSFALGGNIITTYMVLVPSAEGGTTQPLEIPFAYDYGTEHIRLTSNGIWKNLFVNNGSGGTGYEYELNREPTLITFQIAGGSITTFVNGIQTVTKTYSPNLGTAGALSIGSEEYSGNTANHFFGYIGEVVIRNVADNSATRQQFRDYFNAKWGVKTNIGTKCVWFHGDSRTSGNYVGQSFPSLIAGMVTSDVTVRNIGAWGKSATADSTSIYNLAIKPYAISGNLLISAYGANDLSTTYTGQQWVDAQQPSWDDFRGKGGKVFVLTIEPRSDKSTAENQKRLDYNALLPGLVTSNKIDGWINTVADTRLNDPSNTTYFQDGVHLTAAGEAIKAQLVYNNISGVLAGGVPLTNPVPPTLTADDTANTLSASHTLGTTEIVFSTNGGAFVAYAGTINVGDVARAAGYYQFKIKAASGRNESAIANSPEFTVAVPVDPTIPTWRNIIKATADMNGTLLFDGDRNSYSAGGEVANGSFTRLSKFSFEIPTNPADIRYNKYGLATLNTTPTDYSANTSNQIGDFRIEIQATTSSTATVWWEGTQYIVNVGDRVELSAGSDGSLYLKKIVSGVTSDLGSKIGGYLTGNFAIRTGIGYTGDTSATPKVYKVRINNLV